MPTFFRIARLLLLGLLLLPTIAAAAAKPHCPAGSVWVAGHRNAAGHWIKGHCRYKPPSP